MNGLTIVGGSIAVFVCAYLTYGRWLARTWGIDKDARTLAYRFEDGQDFTPATRQTVFAHQISSIVGAGGRGIAGGSLARAAERPRPFRRGREIFF